MRKPLLILTIIVAQLSFGQSQDTITLHWSDKVTPKYKMWTESKRLNKDPHILVDQWNKGEKYFDKMGKEITREKFKSNYGWKELDKIFYSLGIIIYSEEIKGNKKYSKTEIGLLKKQGFHQYRVGSYDKALLFFTMAISSGDGKDTVSYKQRGIINHRLGNYNDAIEDYSKAIALNPIDENVYLNRGSVLHEHEKYQEAIEDYRMGIKIDSDDHTFYNNMAWSYHLLENADSACYNWLKAKELGGGYPKSFYKDKCKDYNKKKKRLNSKEDSIPSSGCGTAEGPDETPYELLLLVDSLDQITQQDTTLRLGENSQARYAKEVMKQLTTVELFWLMQNHNNPVIKGYSFIELISRQKETDYYDEIYKDNFLPFVVCYNEDCERNLNGEEMVDYLSSIVLKKPNTTIDNKRISNTHKKMRWPTSELSKKIEVAQQFWTLDIDSTAKVITVSLDAITDHFNEHKFMANFPVTIEQIDTSKFYNKVNLGELMIYYLPEVKPTIVLKLKDENYLKKVSHIQMQSNYQNVLSKSESSSWDCTDYDFEDVYDFYFDLKWSSILKNRFSLEEIRKLKMGLAKCIGAEYSEDYFTLESLMMLME